MNNLETMDIQLEKQELINLLKETENPSILIAIKKIFQKEQKDWWLDLSEVQKEAIEEGLRDVEEGRVVSYEEVKKQFGWK